jgi:hypothetical protein
MSDGFRHLNDIHKDVVDFAKDYFYDYVKQNFKLRQVQRNHVKAGVITYTDELYYVRATVPETRDHTLKIFRRTWGFEVVEIGVSRDVGYSDLNSLK